MRQIDILWKLQEIENDIQNHNACIKEVMNSKSINHEIDGHKIIKKELVNSADQINTLKLELQKLENDLIDMEHRAKELKKKLYDGKINDLKQLGSMLKEQEKIEKKSLEVNKEFEEKMIELENYEKAWEILKTDEKEKDTSIRLLVKNRKHSMVNSEEALDKLSKERDRLSKLLAKENHEIYSYTKARKSNPVSVIESNICGGCHMDLPIITLSKMNRQEIVTCNNCGRILYNKSLE